MCSEELLPFFQISGLYSHKSIIDVALERDGAAALRIVPVLVGKPELEVAFVADQIGAFATITLLELIAGKAGIVIGRKGSRAICPDKEVDAFPGFLVREKVDLPVVHLRYRYLYLPPFGPDNGMFCRQVAAGGEEERKAYHEVTDKELVSACAVRKVFHVSVPS